MQNSVESSVVTYEPFVDAEKAAAFLSMSRKMLLDMARKGVAPGHPVGGKARKVWKFRISELEAWMQVDVHSTQRLRACSRRIF